MLNDILADTLKYLSILLRDAHIVLQNALEIQLKFTRKAE